MSREHRALKARRDAGLRRVSRINRWLVGGSIVATGAATAMAAEALPGKPSKRFGAAAPASAAVPATDGHRHPRAAVHHRHHVVHHAAPSAPATGTASASSSASAPSSAPAQPAAPAPAPQPAPQTAPQPPAQAPAPAPQPAPAPAATSGGS